MLLVIGPVSACILCICVVACFVWSQNQQQGGVSEAAVSLRLNSMDQGIANAKTIKDAMEYVRKTNPDVKVLRAANTDGDLAFWKKNYGWAMIFYGTSPADPVRDYQFGLGSTFVYTVAPDT